MLEILCKVSFFLSMLVAYAYVTSTSKVIAIVLVYSLCVFSYYYFNVIQSAIDEFFKYFNFNEKFNGNINPSQVPIPYVSPVESATYHNIKYPSLRQMSNYRFDKSTLRHLSKMPKIYSTSAVRIAPPESISISNLNDKCNSNSDRYSEDIKNDKYLQVLREISRKRNYQEEADRIDSTPKKSRRNDISKYYTTSHSKRSHDDGSYDNLDDTSRKKRCSDSDRSVAKILSYTSSLMHVVAPNLTWNNHSKKRKSSKIEKSVNESPENVEKLRKINHDEITEDIENYHNEQADNCTYVVKQHIVPVEVHENFESQMTNGDECDSRSLYEPPLPDDDGEYVRVASGKILNRTNCMYRKKLNSNRIDPQSVITLEPELVNGNSNDDDEAMKKNLVRNLIDDIERKGEKDESVIFYENSIVEEIAKNQNRIEPVIPQVVPNNPPPSFNPLLSQATPSITTEKKSFASNFTPKPPMQTPPVPKQLDLSTNITFDTSTNPLLKPDSNPTNNPSVVFNSSSLNNSSFSTNPVGSSTFNSSPNLNPLLFRSNPQVGVDTVDSTPKSNPLLKPEEKKQVETTQATVSNGSVSLTSAVTTAEPSNVASSPKSGFLFPCVVSTAPSNALTNSTSMVNSASFSVSVSSTQQNGSINAINTTTSNPPIMSFGAPTASPFSLAAKNDPPKSDVSSGTPQFGNTFATNSNMVKPTENVQKNPLSGITMFGNTAISTSAGGTSDSNAVFTSSNSVPSFTNSAPSRQFQFGQGTAPSTSSSTGFSFGAVTNTSSGGFPSTTTSAPTAFSVATPAFGAAATSSFNTTSVLSFTSATPAAFGANTGLKFDAKPTQSAPSFPTPSFNATTTASSFAPSVPSFGTTQSTTFGMAASGGFGAASTQSNPTFGNTSSSQPTTFGASSNPPLTFGSTSSQPQATTVFGNATTQATPTFGSTQPPAFGAAQTTMFGSGDPSVFSQTAKPAFGAPNPPQFGSSTGFSFGASSNETQSTPAAFGSTPAPAFGNTSAAQPPSFSSSTPSFNFNAGGTTSFGGNVFGATPAKPAETTFAFGSNNTANAPAPAQNPVFQFGTAPQQPASQNQPFTFGASAGATVGFSIGTGGNTRNRATRSRRK